MLSRVAGPLGAAAAAAAASAATIVPVAYHEAGHTILAHAVSESGVRCGSAGKLSFTNNSPSLVKFTTIVPRRTPKGQYYVGETKLTVRWRHMSESLHFTRGASSSTTNAILRPPDGDGEPASLLTLTRLAYLFGGRAAEDAMHGTPSNVESIRSAPGLASGDLRKAEQLADGSAARLEAGYAYARDVLTDRWPQVQATAAALLVGGTLDGASFCALLEQLERARPASPLLHGACWAWAERRRLREAHALVLEPR